MAHLAAAITFPCLAARSGSVRTMLFEGLWLMAIGMGTVFAFLLLLVACMHASASVFARFPDDPVPGLEGSLPNEPSEDLLLVAVALAIAERERA